MDLESKNFSKLKKRLKNLEQQELKAVQKQHSKGKLSARERINLLFDEGSFTEIDAFITTGKNDDPENFGDGVISGFGKIKGRTVYVYAQDFSVQGGSLGIAHARKIVKVQQLALKTGSPIVGLIDSGGARIQEGVDSLVGYGSIFHLNVQSSGIIPQISVIMGPAAGGAVYSPALTDFVFMTNHTSYMFVTGPNVVKEVLNEDVSFEDLGGAKVHAEKSGVAHFIYEDDENTILGVRKLFSYLPSNHLEHSPFINPDISTSFLRNKLLDIVPDDPNKPYDIKKIIELLVDKNSFFEISEKYAQNLVTGLARMDGYVIGIVANQPKILAGALDIDASLKGARFVRFCDAFNIPLLVLEDVPGFMPGLDQEKNGIIKHGAKLLFAFSEATVPKITVILRKAYGGAYVVMNCQSIGSDFTFAWPTAEIAVMGPEGAVSILNKKELADSDDPVKTKKELAAVYRQNTANPFIAEESGYIEEVINPVNTREKIIRAFEILQRKQVPVYNKKHNNLPL